MTAVDTNVVVRLLTNDEPRQARRTAAVFAGERVWLSRTVLLESEWVLRHAYGIEGAVIVAAFRKLLGLVGATTEHPEVVEQALSWFEGGMDFADALHLAAARAERVDRFVTFDSRLVKHAARRGVGEVVHLRA